MGDNKNTIIAVILSAIILVGWQYFYSVPMIEKEKAE